MCDTECKLNCQLCKHVLHDYGDYSVGMPAYDYCGIPDSKEKQFDEGTFEKLEAIGWDSEKAPEICGRFSPRLIEECGVCQKILNVPEIGWTHWFMADDVVFVCGDECKYTGYMKYQEAEKRKEEWENRMRSVQEDIGFRR